MAEILIGIPAAIIIAAFSSWITVQMSLQRFRREKWWELKAEAYTRVIEALHNSKEFTIQHLDADKSGREVPEEKDKELRAKSNAANAEIRRATSIGAFLLSDQALARLSRFRKEEHEASSATNWTEYLIDDWNAVSSCLDDVIKIAKADLEV